MKFKDKKSYSQSGAAELVMVLVAATIGGMIMLNSSSIITRVQNQNRNTNQVAGAADLKGEIETFLSVDANCAANFNIVPAGANTFLNTDIVDAGGTGRFDASGTDLYHNGQLKILRWSLEDTGPVLDVAPTERKIVTLNVVLEKQGTSIGPKEIVRKVKMVATKVGGPGTAIASCRALIGAESDLWVRSISGTDIYNTNTGNIGIGTSAPTAKLHVTDATTGIGNILIADALTLAGTPANSGFNITAGDMGVGGNLSHFGSLGIGVAAPTVAFDVLGNMLVTGNKAVATTTTVGGFIAQGNTSIGGSLSVSGAAWLQSLIVNGTTSLGGASIFRGTGQISGPLTTGSSVSVNSASFASAGNDLQVNGRLDVTGNLNSTSASVTTSMCIGGDCITTFALQNCPSGTIERINEDGTLVCAQSTCGANSYVQGLTGTSSPTCRRRWRWG